MLPEGFQIGSSSRGVITAEVFENLVGMQKRVMQLELESLIKEKALAEAFEQATKFLRDENLSLDMKKLELKEQEEWMMKYKNQLN